MSYVPAFLAVAGATRTCPYYSTVSSDGSEFYHDASNSLVRIGYFPDSTAMNVFYVPDGKFGTAETISSWPASVRAYNTAHTSWIDWTIHRAGKLSVSCQTGGSISVTTGGTYVSVASNQYVREGVPVVLTRTATNANYAFDGWYVDGSLAGTNNTFSFTTDTSVKSVQARFHSTLRTLTLAAGTGGSPTAVPSAGTVTEGTTVTLYPNPSAGYSFEEWTLEGGVTGTSSNPNYSFTMPQANVTATASYVQTGFSLSIPVVAGGSGASTPSPGLVEAGTPVALSVTSEYGFTFALWTLTGGISDTSDDPSYSFTMPSGNVVATPSFNQDERITITLTKVGTLVSGSSLSRGYYRVREGYNTYKEYNLYFFNPIPFAAYAGVPSDIGGGTDNGAVHYLEGIYADAGLTTKIAGQPSGATSWAITVSPSANTTYYLNFLEKIQKTVVYRASDSATYSPGNAAETAGCAVTVSPYFASGTSRETGNSLVFTASAVTGWELKSWKVEYEDATSATFAASPTLTITLAQGTTVTGVFGIATYTVLVEVDGPSADASAGTVSLKKTNIGGEDIVQDNPYESEYGETLKAVASANAGFAFEGWYRNDIKVIGAAGTGYYFTVNEDVTITAKFTAQVSLTVAELNGASGSAAFCSSDGTIIAPAPATRDVIIGDTFYLTATPLTEGTFFRGYFEDGDSDYPLFPEEPGPVTPGVCDGYSQPTAVFDTSADYFYLRMTNDPENIENTGLGVLSATGYVDELTETEFEAILGWTPGTLASDGKNKYYKFLQGSLARISVTALTSSAFVKWRVCDMDAGDGELVLGEERDLSTENPVTLRMYRNLSVRAVWRYGAYIPLSLFYATGSDSTMGGMSATPAGDVVTSGPSGLIGQYLENDEVLVTAVPNNTYKFAGWYLDAACTQLHTADISFSVTIWDTPVEEVYYAKFEQDADAVYKWDGGSAPKRLLWRSKRMIASAPFDPAAVRVMADGYPVTFNLYACSSPNSPSPTVPTKRVYVTSEQGVRLPAGRKERYFEIEVESPYQVTEVTMSSSLGGLAQ